MPNYTKVAEQYKSGKTKKKKQSKMEKVMHEFKMGKLKSSSGQKVTNRRQAIAIGIAESKRV